MSISTTPSESLSDALDPAIAETVQQGRLDDAEIQRLVLLSRDAGYQRSDRVPVKTVEAFEPRSLVSIAMDAQRRREAEMRTAAAAGVVIDPETAADADGAAVDAEAGDHPQDDQTGAPAQADAMMPAGEDGDAVAADDANALASADADAEEGADDDESPSQGTSQIDFEAGHAAGLEEGRQSGLEEGHAKGLEEGRAAGRAEASAQLERAIQAFEAAAGKLDGLTGIDSKALGDSIQNAILKLASERAGRAITEQPDAFADRVEGLLVAIRAASGQPVIRLNPGDLGSIQPLVETREKLRHCSFVAAPDLAPGDLTVTVGTIGIDDIILPAPPAADDADISEVAVEAAAAQPEMADAETDPEAEARIEAEAEAEIRTESATEAEVETGADDGTAGEIGDVADIDPEAEASMDSEPQTGDDDD